MTFEDARKVLLILLADVGEEFWREKLATLSSDSFKSILGGMGSFNDLIICVENKQRVADDKQPLANELLSWLTEVCFVTAQRGPLPIKEAVAACGKDKAILHGWRCQACGYSQVSDQSIRAFVASGAVRGAFNLGIDEVYHLWKSGEDAETLQAITNLVNRSGIHLTRNKGWMRPCPFCQSDDTCVYRWQSEKSSFIPTSDNLPLEGKP